MSCPRRYFVLKNQWWDDARIGVIRSYWCNFCHHSHLNPHAQPVGALKALLNRGWAIVNERLVRA